MNTFLAVLSDFSILLIMIAISFGAGWLACSIIADGKLRRIRTDTWREASRYYAQRFHHLVSKQ